MSYRTLILYSSQNFNILSGLIQNPILSSEPKYMNNIKICVIGLGYVGLPLARLFSTKYPTIGFDMNQARVDALNGGHDATLEVSDELLENNQKSI